VNGYSDQLSKVVFNNILNQLFIRRCILEYFHQKPVNLTQQNTTNNNVSRVRVHRSRDKYENF